MAARQCYSPEHTSSGHCSFQGRAGSLNAAESVAFFLKRPGTGDREYYFEINDPDQRRTVWCGSCAPRSPCGTEQIGVFLLYVANERDMEESETYRTSKIETH